MVVAQLVPQSGSLHLENLKKMQSISVMCANTTLACILTLEVVSMYLAVGPLPMQA